MFNRAKGALASAVSGSRSVVSPACLFHFKPDSRAGRQRGRAGSRVFLRGAICQPERGVQVQPQESVGEKKRLISDRANPSGSSSGTRSSLCVRWTLLDKRINFVHQRSQGRGAGALVAAPWWLCCSGNLLRLLWDSD